MSPWRLLFDPERDAAVRCLPCGVKYVLALEHIRAKSERRVREAFWRAIMTDREILTIMAQEADRRLESLP